MAPVAGGSCHLLCFYLRTSLVPHRPLFTCPPASNHLHRAAYAEGDPWNAICSRGDLASSPSPDGCLDGKVRYDIDMRSTAL